MKTRALILASVLSTTICSRTFADVMEEPFALTNEGVASWSNSSISREYERLEDAISLRLDEDLRLRRTNAFISIKTAGYLRAKKALPRLSENLGFPITFENPASIDALRFITDKPAPFRGEFMLLEGCFPAIGAIDQVGLTYEGVTRLIDVYPSSRFAASAFAGLGFATGGAYFGHVVSQQVARGSQFHSLISSNLAKYPNLHNPPKSHWSFWKSNFLFTTNFDNAVCARYDAMQDALLTRFSTELPNASINLPDTIATMGYIRSLDAIPVLADNLTICPQASTNAPNGFVFPAVEALISIGPAIGDCFERLKATKQLSLEESLWLRISHELYPEGLEYELYCAAATNDTRAARLLQSLPWRRLSDEDCEPVELRQEMIEGKKQTEMKGDD